MASRLRLYNPFPGLRELRLGPGRECMPALVLAIFLVSACGEMERSETNLVVVGDSASAGHQNGCTVHTQQGNGYAKLLANQAGWRLDQPLISEPGVRPCMEILITGDITTIQRMAGGGDPNDPATWGSRLDPSATNGVTAKMGMDATVPLGALENEFRPLIIPGADGVDIENL